MIRASVYGRLGRDPEQRQTHTGKAMVTASLAVNVNRHGEDEDTEWFSLSAFGRVADDLARHQKGDLIAVMGQLNRRTYAGRDGGPRQAWQLTADAIVSARVVRPGGRKAKPADATTGPAPEPAKQTAADGPDDEIPF